MFQSAPQPTPSGARQAKARAYEVYGYAFPAHDTG